MSLLHQSVSQLSSISDRLVEVEANGMKMASNLAMLDTMVGNNVRDRDYISCGIKIFFQ